MTPASVAAVLAANKAFYQAFSGRDPGAMSQIWARDHLVACTHPGRAALHGRDAVLASWRAILESPESPRIRFSDATAIVIGQAAYVTCAEHIGEARLAATNVFVMEQGEWRLVHHHAGPIASTPSRRPPSDLN